MSSESLILRVVRLLRWHKPAGRLILMIPALWGLVLACHSVGTFPPIDLTVVIVLGSLATSAMGCVINDFWDRDLDRAVERTRNRPFAEKSLSLWVGGVILIIASGCALLAATYLNRLSFGLCLGAVPIIIVYPLCKRVFALPQLVLSLAWGFAVLIPWSAVTKTLDLSAWLLWGATLTWTMGFDTIYALSDREDDLKVGIRSSAIFFGDYVTQGIGVFLGLTTLLLGYLGWEMNLTYPYFYGLALVSIGWLWQWTRLDRVVSPALYPQLFKENVVLGFILLGSMLLA